VGCGGRIKGFVRARTIASVQRWGLEGVIVMVDGEMVFYMFS